MADTAAIVTFADKPAVRGPLQDASGSSHMMPFVAAMMIFGLLGGALKITSPIFSIVLVAAPAIQVWLKPESAVPRRLRESQFYRRSILVEWILTALVGVLVLGLSYVSAQYIRQLISN